MKDQVARPERHSSGDEARLRIAGSEETVQVRNAGPGGALIVGENLPAVGKQVTLLFEDDENRPSVRVVAAIAHAPNANSRGVRFGRAYAPGGLLSLCRFLARIAVGPEGELVDRAERQHADAPALSFDFRTREFSPRPRSIDENSRETIERANCSSAVSMRYGPERWHGTLRNLGQKGAFVTCTQLPPIGCELEMSIPHAPTARTRVEVRWREDRVELGVGLGLRLLEPQGSDEEAALMRFRTGVQG